MDFGIGGFAGGQAFPGTLAVPAGLWAAMAAARPSNAECVISGEDDGTTFHGLPGSRARTLSLYLTGTSRATMPGVDADSTWPGSCSVT